MSTQDKPLSKRSVVSSLIFKFPETGDGKPVVALFRRSEKVNTYRHHLAPISGSIDKTDPSPLSAAWREIKEETTLTPESLVLFRQGKPFTFSDPSIGREWTVHPFGFRLKTNGEGGTGEEGIQIDWEHEGWEWHDPNTVIDSKEFGGVPRLKESLSRVWFETDMGERAGNVLADGLDKLKNDHERGARELAAIALSIFRKVIAEMRSDVDPERWWELVRIAGWHLWKNGRESMGAAIVNVIVSALTSIEPIISENSVHPAGKKDKILAVIDEIAEKRKSTGVAVSDAVASYLKTNFASKRDTSTVKILTLSSSSTIRSAILHVASIPDIKRIELNVLESRPLCEGVSIASAIQLKYEPGSAQLKTTLYTDASAALAAKDVDVLVLGADRIASSGDVSNKTGSLPAVLSAKYVNPVVKVVVLSELEKVAEPGSVTEHVVEENEPTEVISSWKADGVKGFDVIEGQLRKGNGDNAALSVKNIYFEWVPADFIDSYICEEGSWNTSHIKERSAWVGEQIDRLFGAV
ncbi:hypothetical protein PVAR5_7487 [Paecilomyces variotii No. 5]|uniref:Nudix hydrolase domain-containing protein n=1 Tax=Byssochlamys spectabilis (strain No. 5 / NBRC 109023) TaxID=1356009 RepID=V5G9U6_BYSSN|nr:hypothetical protein PVAR5_7487 [Paecilomyces variotii No. 5]